MSGSSYLNFPADQPGLVVALEVCRNSIAIRDENGFLPVVHPSVCVQVHPHA